MRKLHLSFQQPVYHPGCLAPGQCLGIQVDLCTPLPDQAGKKGELFRRGGLRFSDLVCKLHRLKEPGLVRFKIMRQSLVKLGSGKRVVVGAVRGFIFYMVVAAQAAQAFESRSACTFLAIFRVSMPIFSNVRPSCTALHFTKL